jgi:hypothetical protein
VTQCNHVGIAASPRKVDSFAQHLQEYVLGDIVSIGIAAEQPARQVVDASAVFLEDLLGRQRETRDVFFYCDYAHIYSHLF